MNNRTNAEELNIEQQQQQQIQKGTLKKTNYDNQRNVKRYYIHKLWKLVKKQKEFLDIKIILAKIKK